MSVDLVFYFFPESDPYKTPSFIGVAGIGTPWILQKSL